MARQFVGPGGEIDYCHWPIGGVVLDGSLIFSTWLKSFPGIGEGWPFWARNGDRLSPLARWVGMLEHLSLRGAGRQTLCLELVG